MVISTNICECGANLNTDIVVDTSTCYIPVINGDSEVVMALRPVSEASCIQRIGRVGRRKSVKEEECEGGRVGRRKKGEYLVVLPFRMAPTCFFPQDTAIWDDVACLLTNELEAIKTNCYGEEEQALFTPRIVG